MARRVSGHLPQHGQPINNINTPFTAHPAPAAEDTIQSWRHSQSRYAFANTTQRRICTSSSLPAPNGYPSTLTQSERAAIDLESKTISRSEQGVQRGDSATPLSTATPTSASASTSAPPRPKSSRHKHHSVPHNEFRALLKNLTQHSVNTKNNKQLRRSSGARGNKESSRARAQDGVQDGFPNASIQSSKSQGSALLSPGGIEQIWQKYTHLAWYGSDSPSRNGADGPVGAESHRPPRLSLREYDQLMDLVGLHTASQRQGGARERRILQLYDDARSIGLAPTTRMYSWTLEAAFAEMATPATILAIHDDFVRSHRHQGTAMAPTPSKDAWKRDHKLLLTIIVRGFANRGMILQGIEFLDRTVHYEDPALVQTLYGQLINTHFAHGHDHHTHPIPKDKVEQDRIIEFFRKSATVPYHKVRKLMSQLERSADGPILIKELSSHGLGSLLIQLREQQSLGALLVSLLRQSQVDEAVRLLDVMVDKDILPPLKTIRTRLMRGMSSQDDDNNDNDGQWTQQEQVLQAWDDATGRRGLFAAEALNVLPDEREIDLEHDPLTVASRARVWTEQPRLQWALQERSTREYEVMIESLIRDQELGTAVNAAKYFAHRGWQSGQMDFRQLNSWMINYGHSDRFVQYFHVRYLMGPLARPDLHAFRRFIYAACRRSDLYTALSLFQIVKTTHPEWELDASLYNPIISTASTIPGRMPVAEKMFQTMRQNGVTPDLYTFHALLNGYANNDQLESAKQIPPLMLQQGLEPTTKTLNLVIKAYLRSRNNVSTSRRLLNIMERSPKSVGPDQVTINMLLESYYKVGNDAWLDQFLDTYVASITGAGTSVEATTSEHVQPQPQADDLEVKSSTKSRSSAHKSPKPSPPPSLPLSTNSIHEHLVALVQQRKEGRGGEHDYWTMYSALRLALRKTDISAKEVWTLWDLVKDQILAPSGLPATHVPFTKVIASDNSGSSGGGNSSSSSSSSKKSALDSNTPQKAESRTMSDADYFKYTSLQLFWHAFKYKGEMYGIKLVNRHVQTLFPDKALQSLYSSPSSTPLSSDSESQASTLTKTQQQPPLILSSKTWRILSKQMTVQSKQAAAIRLETWKATQKQAKGEREHAKYQFRATKREAVRVKRRQQMVTKERFGTSWSHRPTEQEKEAEEEREER
ncbi:hypothetical protein DFQ26_008559 [Actinomortierella ambigua]|nr:hypothetical protein DFQ26_008559 [Actinomortierella ambigua]